MNKVSVLDFGSQYTQLITRKIRELGVYAEIFPYNISLEKLGRIKPAAIVLSGGPQSVYERNAPHPDPRLFSLGIPILGICYGLQVMVENLSGKVGSTRKREYGFAQLEVRNRQGLLADVEDLGQVWMSHGDYAEVLPPGFEVTGVTENCPAAVIEAGRRGFYGVQFHPEVVHTHQGMTILSNFLFRLAGLKADWTMESFIERKVDEIRAQVGNGKVICGLSGGVDSMVTSLLVHRAVQDNLTCIFVDNGLLRKNQFSDLMGKFKDKFHLNVLGLDETDLFLERLAGKRSPERKRKIIGAAFVDIFQREAKRLGRVDFLAQGTIYPDVIESNPVKGPSSSIKSHHNVGGLSKKLRLKLVEPLRELFKDEVRALGLELGLDRDFIAQHPFPGPGLAVRIVGEVTRERLSILREADAILLEEIGRAGVYDNLWQAFAVLLPVKAVGVMGDRRTYQRVVVLRLVQSIDGMTADWYAADSQLLTRISNRIVNEVDGVNRIVYDITSKPPGTIEWE